MQTITINWEGNQVASFPIEVKGAETKSFSLSTHLATVLILLTLYIFMFAKIPSLTTVTASPWQKALNGLKISLVRIYSPDSAYNLQIKSNPTENLR